MQDAFSSSWIKSNSPTIGCDKYLNICMRRLLLFWWCFLGEIFGFIGTLVTSSSRGLELISIADDGKSSCATVIDDRSSKLFSAIDSTSSSCDCTMLMHLLFDLGLAGIWGTGGYGHGGMVATLRWVMRTGINPSWFDVLPNDIIARCLEHVLRGNWEDRVFGATFLSAFPSTIQPSPTSTTPCQLISYQTCL